MGHDTRMNESCPTDVCDTDEQLPLADAGAQSPPPYPFAHS